MNPKTEILICDDDPIAHLKMKQSLRKVGKIRSAYHGDEALAIIKHHSISVLLLDIHMRKPKEGLQYIPIFLKQDPDLAIIICSGDSHFRTAMEAMKLGAVDYILKDINSNELIHAVFKVLERRSFLQGEQQQNFETLHHHMQHALIGNSEPIRQLKKIIGKVKKGSVNVLITGETGTGKELVARQLRHELENKTLAPFLAIDSATIQHSTAESILFGHEKGAFTGADKCSRGLFEEANNGIVYFDEISNMPLNIQPKLLRVLQEKEVTRLGSYKPIQLNFRVICATNQDLESMANKQEFKADLLQRLNVIPIHVPPLRERIEDIPILLEHFSSKQNHHPIIFHPESVQMLQQYTWPGNIRELSNLVAHLSTMIDGDTVTPADLPVKFRISNSKTARSGTYYQKIAQFEKELLIQACQKHQGAMSQLAVELGMDRSHLYTKLKQFGIQR